jgi:hypothetical protein
VLYEGNPVIPGPEADERPGYLRWIEEVIVVDGTYHMFFTGSSVAFTVDHAIGHATSPDGISWTKDPGNPIDVLGEIAEQPQVLLHAPRGECEMFYSWPGNDESDVNRATSSCQATVRVRRPSGRRSPVGAGAHVDAPERR